MTVIQRPQNGAEVPTGDANVQYRMSGPRARLAEVGARVVAVSQIRGKKPRRSASQGGLTVICRHAHKHTVVAHLVKWRLKSMPKSGSGRAGRTENRPTP
ncbi:hypothetical protein J6590_020341 [Homalodisca vitripennis]|nr:hypothetical protein J6590_020341 [Homalodisca vitripennis]